MVKARFIAEECRKDTVGKIREPDRYLPVRDPA
jgi:hypothetical protein